VRRDRPIASDQPLRNVSQPGPFRLRQVLYENIDGTIDDVPDRSVVKRLSVLKYQERLAGTNVVLHVLPGLTHADELTSLEDVLPPICRFLREGL